MFKWIRWEWLILGAIIGLGAVYSLVLIDRLTAERPESPYAERNEWGQVIRPLSYQCVATILRWSKRCGYEWVDSQQVRDDNEQ